MAEGNQVWKKHFYFGFLFLFLYSAIDMDRLNKYRQFTSHIDNS